MKKRIYRTIISAILVAPLLTACGEKQPAQEITEPAIIAATDDQYAQLGIKKEKIKESEDGCNTEGATGTFEEWLFTADLEDGSCMRIRFETRSPWFTESKVTPACYFDWIKADGEKISLQTIDGNAVFSPDTCDIQIGECKVTGNLDKYFITINKDNIELEMMIKNNATAWRPESGYIFYGKEQKQYTAWLCAVPDGEVTVNVTEKSETEEYKKGSYKGSGYHDHSWGNVSLQNVEEMRTIARVRTDNQAAVIYYSKASEEYGNREICGICVTENGEPLIDDINFITYEESGKVRTKNQSVTLLDEPAIRLPEEIEFVYDKEGMGCVMTVSGRAEEYSADLTERLSPEDNEKYEDQGILLYSYGMKGIGTIDRKMRSSDTEENESQQKTITDRQITESGSIAAWWGWKQE